MIARARTRLILTFAGIASALIYGTLFPFSGWEQPPGFLWTQFFAPEARLGIVDICINVAIYLPLGFVLIRLLPHRIPQPFGVFITVISTALFSTSLELLQGYLPARVSSLYDVMFNIMGAALGAILATKAADRNPFARFASEFRERHVKAGGLPILGIFVVGLWSVAELIPFVPSLAIRNLDQGIEPISLLFNADVPLSLIATIGYTGATLAIAVILHTLLITDARQSRKVAAIIAGTLAFKVSVIGRHLLPEQLIGAAIGLGLYHCRGRLVGNRMAIPAMAGLVLL
ncbi:MAG: VanZ family protein, partial [Gammaproteobacteria bacterium]